MAVCREINEHYEQAYDDKPPTDEQRCAAGISTERIVIRDAVRIVPDSA